ncbi:MAG: 2-oxoacid:acceptor oxidoreductase subunit alpha [Flavobacteriales bacterium]|nr:2-oxoacid:acceptor oxidoreductase subunit alpha [Bacteroidota bacterium]MCB9241238.1 2-oxoacid:acceptor oxidoreductase subunit alpha [Flavobacteriales bacterium]
MKKTNDFVIRFANVNGTGSASANFLFAKSVFRMGIPISAKNIFPSNIQGLPTWYEVRVSEKGYLGRRSGIDLMVAVNPQSLEKDIASVKEGGVLLYDCTKPLYEHYLRPDIRFIGIPLMKLCNEAYTDPRQRQLFKNIIYVGALAELLGIEFNVLEDLLAEQFAGKEKLIPYNVQALQMGVDYVRENNLNIALNVERRDLIGDKILMEGNAACALGAIYGGATMAAWYPITPSTSVAQAFESYAEQLRIDPVTGQKKFAVLQAEDELAAMGMVIGAGWNGARSFTATSGPGVSLMNEFIGLSYFAEIPAVLIDVQRTGPSTGMPTRTQQSDLTEVAYASHGDTKHPVLIPSNPKECFEMTALSFDLAERLQTLVVVLIDLDLGMNDHVSEPLKWDDSRTYDRGKVLSADDLDRLEKWGRYLDVDGDGIPYRTLPGTHPQKGGYFTRGTSRDEYAKYTEDGKEYKKNMDRLLVKWETTKTLMPSAELYQSAYQSDTGLLFFGTTAYAATEAMERLEAEGGQLDAIRIKSFPFGPEVEDFIRQHKQIFVIEQNRDAQMRSLLINELDTNPAKLIPILNYDGMPITAANIVNLIQAHQPITS